MLLYNVTVKIDAAILDDWLRWMKNIHIPDVMNTGLFVEYRMCRLLEQDESDGITFAIQYLCRSMHDYETYRDKFAPALQREHFEKFGERFVAFRTLMQIL